MEEILRDEAQWEKSGPLHEIMGLLLSSSGEQASFTCALAGIRSAFLSPKARGLN